MKRSSLEVMVHSYLDELERGRREDSRFELKRCWVEPSPKLARRIAAHCNALRDGPAIWVFGVADNGEVVGCEPIEKAKWRAELRPYFVGEPPVIVSDVDTSRKDKQLSIVAFATDLPPYMVRSHRDPERAAKGGEEVLHEVPWREMTTTRSARREELLSILRQYENFPEIEKIEHSCECIILDNEPTRLVWRALLTLYIVPVMRAVLPWHRVSGTIYSTDGNKVYCRGFPLSIEGIGPVPAQQGLLTQTVDEAIFDGPSKIVVVLKGKTPISRRQTGKRLRLEVALSFVGAVRPWISSFELFPSHSNEPDRDRWGDIPF